MWKVGVYWFPLILPWSVCDVIFENSWVDVYVTGLSSMNIASATSRDVSYVETAQDPSFTDMVRRRPSFLYTALVVCS